MELDPSEVLVAPVGAIWPPPSSQQSPVYEFRLNHAMIRSRVILLRIYQPNFWGRKLEVSEHGLSGFRLKPGASYLPWADIGAITLARKRCQVCISYGYPTFGFKPEVAQIFSMDQESFALLGVALERSARCAVVKDDKIYWSYRKLMVGFSVFWLLDLSAILNTYHFGQWTGFWGRILGLLNHLVGINLP